MLQLILGGARSGKSALAVRRAAASGRPVVFIATAQAWDEEMRERIERHRDERPSEWTTAEAPIELAAAVRAAPQDACLIIDCLTLWLSNVLFADDAEAAQAEAAYLRERAMLIEALGAQRGDVILVSNEVGLALVPETPIGRRFRDEQGRLNQQIAALCDRVTLVVAGLPLEIKPTN